MAPAGRATSPWIGIRKPWRPSPPGPVDNGYDAAIWTALKSNFDESDKGGEPFSVTAAIRYLETLASEDADKFARALTYIRKAPPEVQTPVREEVLKRWPD